MGVDLLKLRKSDACRALNSTPLGTVTSTRQLDRYAQAAGWLVGDGKTINLVRLTRVARTRAAPSRALVDLQRAPGPNYEMTTLPLGGLEYSVAPGSTEMNSSWRAIAPDCHKVASIRSRAAMSSPQWYFQPVSPNDRVRGSQVEKFFKSDVLENRPTAVVREGIQNSLDAIADGYNDVLVRIGLGRAPSSAVRPFIPGLFPHLEADAVRAKLSQLPTIAEDVCYLTFEDFHTTGLEGNPAQWEPLDDVKNPFFNFFRGEGVTDKSGNARGRHGVGKLAFSALALLLIAKTFAAS